MYHITIMRILNRAAQLLYDWQGLHCGELATYTPEEIFECAGRHKWRDRVQETLTLAKFEKRKNIWMLELTYFFRFGHKIFTEGLTLSKARAEHLHRHLVISFSSLASTVYIRDSSPADALQQEILTQ